MTIKSVKISHDIFESWILPSQNLNSKVMFWIAMLLVLGMDTVDCDAIEPKLYCSTNTYPSNSTLMHFTKEPIPVEYGYLGKPKSIYCCAKGHRSIEWFKDGVAYPWSANMTNLLLSTDAANQTLYTRSAAADDSGNYTCKLTNHTHSETHTLTLHILDKPTDSPKLMFVSRNQSLEVGAPLRLYCEALIARYNLADAKNVLGWRKMYPNGTEGNLPTIHNQTKTIRNDVDDIMGSYLEVESVSAEDFGTYECVVYCNDAVCFKEPVAVYDKFDMSGGRNKSQWLGVGGARGAGESGAGGTGGGGVPWRTLVLCGAGAGALALTAAVLHARCSLRLLLAVRQARALTHTAATRARVLEKEFDVLVCWTRVDESLVRGALLPTLTLKYKYRVLAVPISTQPDTWYEELVCSAGRCRSVVCVVSPAQYSPAQLLTALRQLRALPLPPVVVLLQDLPKLKREAKESGESLVGVLRRTRLVPWRHVHERAFWTELRYALPMPPHPHPQQDKQGRSIVIDVEDKSSRSGSTTALV